MSVLDDPNQAWRHCLSRWRALVAGAERARRAAPTPESFEAWFMRPALLNDRLVEWDRVEQARYRAMLPQMLLGSARKLPPGA